MSLSRPANNGFCPLANMKKLHGWSTWNLTGGSLGLIIAHPNIMTIPVAAAASVPFSSTDITALWIASDTNNSGLPGIWRFRLATNIKTKIKFKFQIQYQIQNQL